MKQWFFVCLAHIGNENSKSYPRKVKRIYDTVCKYWKCCPIFAQIFLHGTSKKIKRIILDIVPGFYRFIVLSYSNTLALAYLDTAFCYNLICFGYGYHLRLILK